jgi:hypothetical protein
MSRLENPISVTQADHRISSPACRYSPNYRTPRTQGIMAMGARHSFKFRSNVATACCTIRLMCRHPWRLALIQIPERRSSSQRLLFRLFNVVVLSPLVVLRSCAADPANATFNRGRTAFQNQATSSGTRCASNKFLWRDLCEWEVKFG